MSADTARYLNRELSWLEFNQRVLEEAQDERIPLLERLKFLAITSTNLDEFFMVRVGGLRLVQERGSTKPDPTGLSPQAQLEAIAGRTRQMIQDQYACYLKELEPKLAAERIICCRPAELSERQMEAAERLFEDDLLPIVTPMAVTGAADFPLLPNQTLNCCLRLPPKEGSDVSRWVILPLGRSVARIVTLPAAGGYSYMFIEDLLSLFADRYFPDREVLECVPFRITRNADLGIREDLAPDLLAEMEQILDARKESECMRMEIADHASGETREFLQTALAVSDTYVFAVPGPIDLAAFWSITDLPGFDTLRYSTWTPVVPPVVDPRTSMFEVLAEQDVLLYHPFETFEPVVRLIEEAADDPDVLSIKIVLYRTSRDSAIVAALRRAAERGKSVTAVLELRARFDEARNIEWARDLERASVQVIYGVQGYKIHAKVCVIVRREPAGIRRYVHYGTGNYNESTARLYTDASLLTCDSGLGADATAFFNTINGYTQVQDFNKIEAAPLGLRAKALELINSEIEFTRQGQRGHIMAKFNSLVDPEMIEALYAASQAGVRIELVVRGICCLRPGVPALSENISVISVIDRYLEHSRIFYFHHGGDELVFISSADWMPRNLDRRLELFVPVEDRACRERLITVVQSSLEDGVKGRRMRPDGSFWRPTDPDDRRGSQERTYRRLAEAAEQAKQSQRMVFKPYRAPGND